MSEGREKYRNTVPSLSDVLAKSDADTAVVTIVDTKDQVFNDKARGDRVALVVMVEEYPDNPYFPSTGKGGGVDRLYDALGDDQGKWKGERVALVRVKDVFNPSTGQRSDKFHVAPAGEWDSIFKEYDRATRSSRPAAKGGRR